MTNNINTIKESKTYKALLDDSFGGVLYNVGYAERYDVDEAKQLIKLWDSANAQEREIAGGIMRGAIGFLKDVVV